MAKYDVGIYGLWFGNNYGSMVTYYALSQVIEKFGYTYAMISNPLGSDPNYDLLSRSDPLRFAHDRYNITPHLPLHRMGELNSDFDAFIIGSDQMWNYFLSRPCGQSYFLGFADDSKKKISYATSFGSCIYRGPADEKRQTQKSFGRFDAISVRDDFSETLCKEEFNVNAVQVLDPVFLCPIEGYHKLIAEAGTMDSVGDDYIFAYILDPNPAIGRSLQTISEQTGKKIVVVFNQTGNMNALRDRLEITGGNVQFVFDVTVQEWLWLFSNAKFVLTDSFHGTCFSVIFHKPFISMKNELRGGKRFTFLLSGFGLTDHLIDRPDEFVTKFNEFGIDHTIDYGKVEELARPEKERCENWLRGALDGSVRTGDHPYMPWHRFRKGEKPAPPYRWNSVEAAEIACVGCGGCASACPEKAITMKADEQGFLRPVVDYSKCTDCGKCLSCCPDRVVRHDNTDQPYCYVIETDKSLHRRNSTGGIFTMAAQSMIKKGGYVCCPVYGADMSVKHILTNDIQAIGSICEKGYLQSDTDGVFAKVKAVLAEGRKVLFLGTPCETAALYAFMGESREGLVTMDRTCHGVTSYKVFGKFTNDEGITDVSPGTFDKEPFFGAYLGGLSKCKACGMCKYNRLPRQADLSAGIFNGADTKGSLILVNSNKGREFFETFKADIPEPKRISLKAANSANTVISKTDPVHKNRKYFFDDLGSISFGELTQGCLDNSLYKAEVKALSLKVPEEYHDLYYTAALTAKLYKGRKIVTWQKSDVFAKILRDSFGLEVAFSVTRERSQANGTTIKHISELSGRRDQYFVAAVTPAHTKEYFSILDNYRYYDGVDYIFRKPAPIVIENYDCSKGRYCDSRGNTIEGFGAVIRKVVFRGCNNHIVLGQDIGGADNLYLDLTANTEVTIGTKTRFNGMTRIASIGSYGASILKIGERCRFTDALIRFYSHKAGSYAEIGDMTTFETNFDLHVNSGKKLIIGKDCMFSHDIELWAGDGHSTFDTQTGQNTNSIPELLPDYKNRLIIGDHVWVAKGAFIMHGTDIGKGSIVGAKSVVKGKYPNNCTIAGNPARLMKENTAWARDNCAADIRSCGEGYY